MPTTQPAADSILLTPAVLAHGAPPPDPHTPPTEAVIGLDRPDPGSDALVHETAHGATDNAAFDLYADIVEVFPAEARGRTIDRVAPWIAGVLALSWTGACVWAAMSGAMAATPAAIIAALAQWSGPLVVIALGWMLVLRSAPAEARRYVDMSHLLRQESAELESRLVAMNGLIGRARAALSAQAADLEVLATKAGDNLGNHSQALVGMITSAEEKAARVSTHSATATEQLQLLRETLPDVARSASDVTTQISGAGQVALSHLQDMIKGLNRLNDFGQACDRQVTMLRDRLDTTLSALTTRATQIDEQIEGAMEALEARSRGFAMDLEKHDTDAREAIRRRAAALTAEIAATRDKLDSEEAQSLTSLRARLNALRDETATIARALREGEASAMADLRQTTSRLTAEVESIDSDLSSRQNSRIEQARQLTTLVEASTSRLIQMEARLEGIVNADQSLSTALDGRLDALERRLSETDRHIEKLTEASVRLLELIRSSADTSREQLPKALEAGETRLEGFREKVAILSAEIEVTRGKGEALAGHLGEAQTNLTQSIRQIDQLHGDIDDRMHNQGRLLTAMGSTLHALALDADSLSARAKGELQTALDTLTGALSHAVQQIETEGAARLHALSTQVGADSGDIIAREIESQLHRLHNDIQRVAHQAAEISHDAVVQLCRNIASADNQVEHLERRVADARARAEDEIDSDLGRRLTELTEAMHTSAIDITRALSKDVADTAWAAYLKGDRGIFARRSVRLLDSGEARAVLALYESDEAFSEGVNRYIHDFEAMLRQLLATRDGNALSITVLSSDVGKLYVALAQAIERLRS
ncbi:hypothetical protein GTZ99_06035 [Novosphingobium sp. FSY-8]|uniref:ATPase n=1 Tax=Novosphingobium ovatum TaxID=1908523 RepID=A0ABW9XC49_9SPHN|nr:hypothetical protein [Novosphingobium ovatum]NBC36116.1 hypothetical protein [Novosphingobium ovatum]